MNEINWSNIRAEYEAGASQRSLATKYGVSQARISQIAKRDGWIIAPLIIPQQLISSDNIPDQGIADLANYLNGTPGNAKMLLNEHKLFADAYTQYRKAKMLEPAGDDFSAFDMREFLAGCTDEELEIVRPIIAAVQARRADKITPIKKVG
jgi:hypothetical protein